MSVNWIFIPAAFLVPVPLQAHVGDWIVPVFEITDEQLGRIDLEDGSILEWEDLGEPSLTTRDFSRFGFPGEENLGHDYADLDFRIWLGWNAARNRIYGSIQAADDSYRGFDDARRVDGLQFYLDGDHSGGQYAYFDEDQLNMQQAQAYAVYVEPGDAGDPNVSLYFRYESDWHNRPPYADAGGGAAGENPVFWVIEFYVTPFDLLVWDDPEASAVSGLAAGKRIGLSINVADSDTDGSEWDLHLFTTENEIRTADFFIDGFLVGKDGTGETGSAVDPTSWARIKASLEY